MSVKAGVSHFIVDDPDGVWQEAYGRAGADLLEMAAPWWDSCHATGCDVDVARFDGDDGYCSQGCRDAAAQEWDERAHAARGWVA